MDQVILRIDFDPISSEKIKGYQDRFKHKFDKFEINKLVTATFEIKPGVEPKKSTAQKPEENMLVFSNTKTHLRVELSSDNIVLVYSKYKNSKIMRADLQDIFNIIIEENNMNTVNRIGLRYINQITIPTIKKLEDWSKFIASELLATPLYLQSTNAQTRFMNVNEFNNDINVSTGFRFGIWNDQYPSPITSGSYILDIDCFTRQPSDLTGTSIEEITKTLSQFCEDTFEKSITDNLRRKMG